MGLLSLPYELLSEIQLRLTSPDLSRFSRSCSALHRLFTPELYRRDIGEDELGPLAWAATHGSAPTVNRAAKLGLSLPTAEFSQLVLLASSKGYTDCVESLLNFQTFDIDTFSESGNTALIFAVSRGNLSLVKLLLDRGADPAVTERSRHRESPLHIAARTGNDDVTRLLLSVGASPSALNSGDDTPLLKAIERGRGRTDVPHVDDERPTTTDSALVETTRIFLESGYQMEPADSTSYLYEACSQGRTALAKFLISHGADPHKQTDYLYTCLGIAAFNGHVDVVQLLIDQGVDGNIASKYGFTPLVEAVHSGKFEVTKLLVEGAGADVNLADEKGVSPLQASMPFANFNQDVVKYLVESGADVNTVSPAGASALRTAVCYANEVVVELLLNHGAATGDAAQTSSLISIAAAARDTGIVKLLLQCESATTVKGSELRSALHAACENEDFACVEMLVNAGADVNTLDEDGESCLQLAIGHDGICQYLVDRGINLERKLNWGYTALLLAVEYGLLDTVDVLLNAGADVTACNDSCQNALMIASQHGHKYLTKQLLELGTININAQCVDGRTALHYAAMRRRPLIVDMLLSHAPSPALQLKDRYGTTPLIAAACQDDLDMVKRILSAGDATLLEDRDECNYTALHWAAMEFKSKTQEFLMAATLDAGLDPNLDAGEGPQHGEYERRCVCDACGRARTSTEMEDADECDECHTNMGDPFLLCRWCLDHGRTCRDEEHTRASHACYCAGSDEEF